MTLSVRAQQILWNTFGEMPKPEKVFREAGEYKWNFLMKLKNCGPVLSAEIARWCGIEVPERVAKTTCPTCGRVNLR